MPKIKTKNNNTVGTEEAPRVIDVDDVVTLVVDKMELKKRKKRDKNKPKGPIPPQLLRSGGVFGPGYHPNRNVNGRPKGHDELRRLIRDIGNTPGGITVEVDGQTMELSRLEVLILSMFSSGDPRDKVTLLEHGFGKVPDKMDLNVARVIKVKVRKTDEDDDDAVDVDGEDVDPTRLLGTG